MLQITLPGNIAIDNPDDFKFNNPTSTKISAVLNVIIPYIFAIAGIILFIMFLAAGFTLLTSAGNQDKVKKGSAMMTSSLIGFLVIFLAYWIMQIIHILFVLELGF